ncbi:hypothetical protein GC209_03980 [bacterium]|nr:hypothetical protein [bacterium]
MILIPALARATPAQCAAHDAIAAQLAKDFGEEARSIGLGQDDTVMELYASARTGTWTLTVTLPSGLSCLVASGGNFETVVPAQQAKGDPA